MLPERKIYTNFDKLNTHLIRGHVKTNKLFWSKVARGVMLLHIPLVNAICLSGGGNLFHQFEAGTHRFKNMCQTAPAQFCQSCSHEIFNWVSHGDGQFHQNMGVTGAIMG